MQQRWLSVAEVATYLGLAEYTIREKVRNRQIPFSRTGDSTNSELRFDINEIDEMMAGRHTPVGGVRP